MAPSNNELNKMKARLNKVSREAALNTGLFKLRRALNEIKKRNLRLTNHQEEAVKKIQKAWRELNKSKIPKFREERSKQIDKESNNLARNLLAMNNTPRTSILGKRRNTNSNSNSNNNQAKGYRKREVNLPNLNVGGKGMGCGYAGIPRYMKRAKERFDNASVVSAFLDYTIATNQYGIVKNINTIIKHHGVPNTTSRIATSNQVYFFMVGLRNVDNAHAISVLVDPGVYKPGFRMWVFDPHGEASGNSIWGRTMRQKVVPLIKQLWGVTNGAVRYYNGPNLQANNNRGVCTTFYVTFMDYIRALIAGENINGITRFAAQNSTERRKFFLNFPPNVQGLVVVKNKTR